MFSLFRKKPQVQQHPLFGELIYRANRNQQTGLAGFWEGRLDLGAEQATKLILWGAADQHPHPQQTALFEQVLPQIENYIAASKEGALQHIQEIENTSVNTGKWTLNHLYFQAYPMSARLQEDLPTHLHTGVAWGFAFDVEGVLNLGDTYQVYSALVNQEWHPTFPFTYY